MIIQRNDPRFWDVRIMERRIRRGEMSRAEYDSHLKLLHDVADKAAPSIPLDEPDERARERRPPVRIISPGPSASASGPPGSRSARREALDNDDDLDDDLDGDDDLA